MKSTSIAVIFAKTDAVKILFPCFSKPATTIMQYVYVKRQDERK
jgi:hypothetical protein